MKVIPELSEGLEARAAVDIASAVLVEDEALDGHLLALPHALEHLREPSRAQLLLHTIN